MSTQANANHFLQYSHAALNNAEGTSITLPQGATTASGVRYPCGMCGGSFGRPQDLRRHFNDMHRPRRQCPFCPFGWSRADKIKTHLTCAHSDILSAEVLEGICALRGQAVIEFMDTYEYIRHNVMPQTYASSAPHFPFQF